jgi:hypothetical protein
MVRLDNDMGILVSEFIHADFVIPLNASLNI